MKFYLDPGAKAFRTDVSGEWYAIILIDGRVGWGHRSIFSEPSADKDRKEPKKSKVEQPQAGEDIAGRTADDMKAPDKSLPSGTDALPAVYIRPPGGTIRENPALDAVVKFYLDPGAEAFKTDVRGEWYAIKLDDGRVGWGHRSIFSDTRIDKNREEPDVSKTINNIEVETISPQETRVLFELSYSDAPEALFIEGEWPRLAFDFVGVRIGNNLGAQLEKYVDARLENYFSATIRVGDGVIERIRFVVPKTPQPKVSVVMNMTKGAQYSVHKELHKKNKVYAITIKKK